MQYDLLAAADVVRQQRGRSPDPIAEARQLITQSLTAQVLLALSNVGFYEYVAGRSAFERKHAVETLGLDSFVFDALLDYLIGLGLLQAGGDNGATLDLTESGARAFNVYSRGVLNIYLGAYRPIWMQLDEALAGKVPLSDPSLARSTRHAAAGTAYATCTFTIPAVLEAMQFHSKNYCLDLGCGTGDFLIQLARLNPDVRGVGVDMSQAAIDQARESAASFGLTDRLEFVTAEVGTGPIPVDKSVADRIDVITSMYMLHEFGRDGRQAIVQVIKNLREQFPERLLFALEVRACAPAEMSQQVEQDGHYGRLDYRLIHALSGQGMPLTPPEWKKVFEDAGCALVEPERKTGGSAIYPVRLG